MNELHNRQPAHAPKVREFYDQTPCTIGYSYVRFELSGAVSPCCISGMSMGNLNAQSDWRDVWFSPRYDQFREKTFSIARTGFHLKEPQWSFCQQCCHRSTNEANAKLLLTDEELAMQKRAPAESADPWTKMKILSKRILQKKIPWITLNKSH